MRGADPAGYNNVYEGTCRTSAEDACCREEMEALDLPSRIGDFPYSLNPPVWVFGASGRATPTAVLAAEAAADAPTQSQAQ